MAYKKLTYLLLFVLNYYTLSAQTNALVAIDNKDCFNCLNQIGYIEKIDSATDIKLVFEKRYRRDSAALLKRLYLQNFKNKVVWSDSLYRNYRYADGVASSVSLVNAESRKTIKSKLSRLNETLPFINSINKQEHKVKFDVAIFGGETGFDNSGAYFYLFNSISNEMKVYDKTDNKLLYNLSLSDSMVKEAFRLRYGSKGKEELEKVTQFTEKWKKVDPQACKRYFVQNDTVYLLGEHRYVYTAANDQQETTVFLSLSTYKGNKLLEFSIVENYIDLTLKGFDRGIRRIPDLPGTETFYYALTGPFFVHNNQPYFALIGDVVENGTNHFWAKYKKVANKYVYDTLFNKSLPPSYKNLGYNFRDAGFIPYSAPYASLYADTTFFSVDTKREDITIPLSISNSSAGPTIGIFDLKVSDHHAYLIYLQNKNKKVTYHYLKYDIDKEQIVVDEAFYQYDADTFFAVPRIDDFDYNYVYLPIANDEILRKKLGK